MSRSLEFVKRKGWKKKAYPQKAEDEKVIEKDKKA